MYLSQMKYHSIYDPLVKINGLQQVILIKKTKTKYPNKVHAWGAFSSKGVIELQFFTGNMDSEKYIKMLSIANSEI